jgi:hypothetical protein
LGWLFGLFSFFQTVVGTAVIASVDFQTIGPQAERFQWTVASLIIVFGIAYMIVAIMLVIGSDYGGRGGSRASSDLILNAIFIVLLI